MLTAQGESVNTSRAGAAGRSVSRLRVWWSLCVSGCFASSFFPWGWHSARLSPRRARLPSTIRSGSPTFKRRPVLPCGRWLQGPAGRHARERVGGGLVRSRFERAGLKPGAPNGSFVQTHAADDRHAWQKNRLESRSPTARALDSNEQDFYPQRFSASGTVQARRGLRGIRHPRAEARLRRLRRPREGTHRPHPRARAGRARPEEPVRRRRHRRSRPWRSRRRWPRRRRARSACSS